MPRRAKLFRRMKRIFAQGNKAFRCLPFQQTVYNSDIQEIVHININISLIESIHISILLHAIENSTEKPSFNFPKKKSIYVHMAKCKRADKTNIHFDLNEGNVIVLYIKESREQKKGLL